MRKAKRKFSVEFKREVVEEIDAGTVSTAQAIRQHELTYNLISRWKDDYKHGRLNNEPTYQGALENKIAALERKVGQQTMEIELLKKARALTLKEQSEKRSVLFREAPQNGGAK